MINVRGYDVRQVPLYIDGIPVYVPYDGYVDFSRFTTADPMVPVPPMTITRMAILHSSCVAQCSHEGGSGASGRCYSGLSITYCGLAGGLTAGWKWRQGGMSACRRRNNAVIFMLAGMSQIQTCMPDSRSS